MVKLMGILNVTPDSFSDGGKFTETQIALNQAEKLFADGAHWVDVGAESTRPGAIKVLAKDEWSRMADFWQAVLDSKTLDIKKFSLDTRNSSTAEKFLKLGGNILNDVSGFQDPEMMQLASQYKATCIVNHFPGETVDEVHEQNICSIERIKKDLETKALAMMGQGIERKHIILDPGIGFGKTPMLNQQLVEFAREVPDWPVLIGYSKKRFLGEDRLENQVNIHAGERATKSGAAYLRVHDPVWYAAIKKTETGL
jgi:dihydropteroate synthase